MSQIVSWEYYNSLFEDVQEEEFKRLNSRAEWRLNLYTHNRVKPFVDAYNEVTATDFERMKYEAVKITICEVINKMYEKESNGVGIGLSSVSNEGRSESYRIITEADKEKELESVMRKGLSGTGLAGAL